jgi:NDP-sugar pyrophosphorylase family protein
MLFLNREGCHMNHHGDAPGRPLGVSDIKIRDLITFYHQQVCACDRDGCFGVINLSSNGRRAAHFREKDACDGQSINGGFFVVEREVLGKAGLASDTANVELPPGAAKLDERRQHHSIMRPGARLLRGGQRV